MPGRVYPVGRLDFATSGVLLATNDGDFADGAAAPAQGGAQDVRRQGPGPDGGRRTSTRGAAGCELEDGKTLPAKVKLLRHEEGKTWFELTITEGRNQQIRRMGDATGFRVMRLARLAFAGITSEGLRAGRVAVPHARRADGAQERVGRAQEGGLAARAGRGGVEGGAAAARAASGRTSHGAQQREHPTAEEPQGLGVRSQLPGRQEPHG